MHFARGLPRSSRARPEGTGHDYLILQPCETVDSFTVGLLPGRYTAEWDSLPSRETAAGATLTVSDQTSIDMSPPSGIAGPAVLTYAAS